MLKKENRLRKREDLEKLFGKRSRSSNYLLSVSFLGNKRKESRFAFVVGARVSKNAVDRNRLRRQLREIARLNVKQVKGGFDVAVSVKTAALGKEYGELEKAFFNAMRRAGLLL